MHKKVAFAKAKCIIMTKNIFYFIKPISRLTASSSKSWFKYIVPLERNQSIKCEEIIDLLNIDAHRRDREKEKISNLADSQTWKQLRCYIKKFTSYCFVSWHRSLWFINSNFSCIILCRSFERYGTSYDIFRDRHRSTNLI